MKTKIKWLPRYSKTMDNDKHGRWARVAYAGIFNSLGLYRGKIARWEIAWIKKLEDPKTSEFMGKFTVHYLFPCTEKVIFDSLKEAQKEVNKNFRWFIKMCTK